MRHRVARRQSDRELGGARLRNAIVRACTQRLRNPRQCVHTVAIARSVQDRRRRKRPCLSTDDRIYWLPSALQSAQSRTLGNYREMLVPMEIQGLHDTHAGDQAPRWQLSAQEVINRAALFRFPPAFPERGQSNPAGRSCRPATEEPPRQTRYLRPTARSVVWSTWSRASML